MGRRRREVGERPAAEGLMQYRFPIDRSWKHPEGDGEERTRRGDDIK